MSLKHKDNIALLISIAAFVFSAWTFYDTYLRETYSLKASVVERSLLDSREKVELTAGVILFNDGNRPIVVMSSHLEVASKSGTTTYAVNGPITLKPGEAQAVRIQHATKPDQLAGEFEFSDDKMFSFGKGELVILTHGRNGESVNKRLHLFTIVHDEKQESFSLKKGEQLSSSFVSIV